MNGIPEGRRSLPAGALEGGSPTQQHRDVNPGSAVPGRVVHCKREPFDVYIGRPSRFGNPHNLKAHGGDRAAVIELFDVTARKRLAVDDRWRESVRELYGKRLGCYCAPKACHGDVLLKLAAELRNDDIESRQP